MNIHDKLTTTGVLVAVLGFIAVFIGGLTSERSSKYYRKIITVGLLVIAAAPVLWLFAIWI